jgi:chemotaxis-related protein WspD
MSETPVRSVNRPLDDSALDAATAHYARPREAEDVRVDSVLVFRLGTEWLALPTPLLDRVAAVSPVHALPHRRSGAPAGLVNVGGDLVVHVSLAGLLGVSAERASSGHDDARRRIVRRLVVLVDARGRLAMTVDEVWGIHHHDQGRFRPVPPTLARAELSFTNAMIDVEGRTVGCLDAPRVMDALSVALS